MHTLAAGTEHKTNRQTSAQTNTSPTKDRWFPYPFHRIIETDIDSHGPYGRYLISTPLGYLLTNAISKVLCRSPAHRGRDVRLSWDPERPHTMNITLPRHLIPQGLLLGANKLPDREKVRFCLPGRTSVA
jgi:hypothetical protein